MWFRGHMLTLHCEAILVNLPRLVEPFEAE